MTEKMVVDITIDIIFSDITNYPGFNEDTGSDEVEMVED